MKQEHLNALREHKEKLQQIIAHRYTPAEIRNILEAELKSPLFQLLESDSELYCHFSSGVFNVDIAKQEEILFTINPNLTEDRVQEFILTVYPLYAGSFQYEYPTVESIREDIKTIEFIYSIKFKEQI